MRWATAVAAPRQCWPAARLDSRLRRHGDVQDTMMSDTSMDKPVASPPTAWSLSALTYAVHKPSVLGGRVGRLQFFTYMMWAVVVAMGLMFAIGLAAYSVPAQAFKSFYTIGMTLVMYGVLPLVVVVLAIKRLHDMGRPGWLALLLLVPVLNAVLLLVLTFAPGQHEPNRHGEVPQAVSTWLLVGALTVPVGLLAVQLLGHPLEPLLAQPLPGVVPVQPDSAGAASGPLKLYRQ